MALSQEASLEIQVNGEARSLPAGSSVADVLASLDLGGKRVAVAVNRSVVPRSQYPGRALAAGDRVEILEAAGGG